MMGAPGGMPGSPAMPGSPGMPGMGQSSMQTPMMAGMGQMTSPMAASGHGQPAASSTPATIDAEHPPQAGAVPAQVKGQWWETDYKDLNQYELAQATQFFTMLDTDRNGYLYEQELAQMQVPSSGGSTWAGRPIGLPAASRLIQLFDINGLKCIGFYEFAALSKFVTKMQTAFVSADFDRSGTLDANEIPGALKAGGVEGLETEAVQAYFAKFAMLGWFGQGLDFMAFMMMCCDVALAKSRFEMLDKDKDGKISLNEMLVITADLTARASAGQSIY